MWYRSFASNALTYSLLGLASPSLCLAANFNMSYVEVNSNPLENVACYIRADNHQPFFAITSVFAVNINGMDPNNPQLFFNPQARAVLESSQVKNVQEKGIKVLVTLLGNHQNAGWSCMTDEAAAKKFADTIVNMVNQYHLDGVDIDDEYSDCTPNNYSMIMLAQAIKSHPNFKGKLLTKALYGDSDYFEARYNGHRLADYLNYGWEMTYYSDDFDNRLSTYLQNGLSQNQLMIGGWTAYYTSPDPYQIGQYTTQHALAGSMVYDITKFSQAYLSQLSKGQENTSVIISENCLS
jgi:hypothetical protein